MTELVCDSLALKAKRRVVFNRLCGCYGQLLCHENDRNLFSYLIEY